MKLSVSLLTINNVECHSLILNVIAQCFRARKMYMYMYMYLSHNVADKQLAGIN